MRNYPAGKNQVSSYLRFERTMISRTEQLRPAALLFDMDGTITEPMLDFPKIKAEWALGIERYLKRWPR
jgi:hypothetical protein